MYDSSMIFVSCTCVHKVYHAVGCTTARFTIELEAAHTTILTNHLITVPVKVWETGV